MYFTHQNSLFDLKDLKKAESSTGLAFAGVQGRQHERARLRQNLQQEEQRLAGENSRRKAGMQALLIQLYAFAVDRASTLLQLYLP